MRHYWVDPQATTRIIGPYAVGDEVVIDGAVITANLRGAAPALDIYLAIEDNTPAPSAYHVLAMSTAFEGAVHSEAARVRETRVWQQVPIGDLLNARLAELDSIVAEVDVQGVQVGNLSSGARAVKTTERAVTQYQNLRLTKDAIPNETAVAMKDQWDAWFPCTKGDTEEILTIIALFHEAVITSNTEAHDDELHRLHDADNWNGLAAYDLTTGWPPAPTPP